jgi:hypothetical protein
MNNVRCSSSRAIENEGLSSWKGHKNYQNMDLCVCQVMEAGSGCFFVHV